jgi:hypothetical protein
MTKTIRGALKGAAIGLAISIAAVSFISGPESVWDWPAFSRGMAVVFSIFVCMLAAGAGIIIAETTK